MTSLPTVENFGTALFIHLLVTLLVDCIGTSLPHKAYKAPMVRRALKVLMELKVLKVQTEPREPKVLMVRKEPKVQTELKAFKVLKVHRVPKDIQTVTVHRLQLLTQLL